MSKILAATSKVIAEKLTMQQLRETFSFLTTDEFVIISIGDTNQGLDARLQYGWSDILRLRFDDDDNQNGEVPTIDNKKYTITKHQANQIIDFVTRHLQKNIVVQCEDGLSRSQAIVRWINDTFNGFTCNENMLKPYSKKVYSILVQQSQINAIK